MKYRCKISGLEFKDSILSISNLRNSHSINSIYLSTHPIFSLATKDLISFSSAALSSPSEIDLYLAGLAVFNKLSPQWLVSASPAAIPIIVANYERMVKLVFSIPIGRRNEFPSFRIDSSNSNFRSLPHWLDAIESVFNEWKISGKELEQHRRLNRLETILTTLLTKRFTSKPASIAKSLADWAAIAADFPSSPFYLPDGTQTTTVAYWKTLIQYSFIESHLEFFSLRVDIDDLADLINWCEINIPHGSTHASILMSKLRKSYGILEEFTRPRVNSPVLIPELISDSKIIKSNSEADIHDHIPIGPEPKRSDFTNNAEYLRARLKWQTGVIRNRGSIAAEL